MTQEQIKAVAGICKAIVETAKEAGPMGAPGGILYAALMAHGCSFSQFQSLMGGLCAMGKLRKSGDCYYAN